MERNRFARHHGQLNGATRFAHRNVCDVFEPVENKQRESQQRVCTDSNETFT